MSLLYDKKRVIASAPPEHTDRMRRCVHCTHRHKHTTEIKAASCLHSGVSVVQKPRHKPSFPEQQVSVLPCGGIHCRTWDLVLQHSGGQMTECSWLGEQEVLPEVRWEFHHSPCGKSTLLIFYFFLWGGRFGTAGKGGGEKHFVKLKGWKVYLYFLIKHVLQCY